MSKIVPIIPSSTPGLLGVNHLPRLWLKSLLNATGQLADGYKDIGPGYDHMVLQAIGIDPDAARTFIATVKPTYFEFEKWIASQAGVKLDATTISDINSGVIGYNHTDDVRTGILSAAGLPDEGLILDAVTLNFIDDLTEVHAAITR